MTLPNPLPASAPIHLRLRATAAASEVWTELESDLSTLLAHLHDPATASCDLLRQGTATTFPALFVALVALDQIAQMVAAAPPLNRVEREALASAAADLAASLYLPPLPRSLL